MLQAKNLERALQNIHPRTTLKKTQKTCIKSIHRPKIRADSSNRSEPIARRGGKAYKACVGKRSHRFTSGTTQRFGGAPTQAEWASLGMLGERMWAKLPDLRAFPFHHLMVLRSCIAVYSEKKGNSASNSAPDYPRPHTASISVTPAHTLARSP